MPANLSLILNIILLLVVVISIGRLMRKRRQPEALQEQESPFLGALNSQPADDIIAVRKLAEQEAHDNSVEGVASEEDPQASSPPAAKFKPTYKGSVSSSFAARFSEKNKDTGKIRDNQSNPAASRKEADETMLVMFLLAKENRNFAGYELLQTLLAAGLRFGEGYLFHRHQFANGQGPVIFSLAAATSSGIFDLQNMGAFTARGLCLFMQASGNSTIDLERFNILYETARQLSEGLDAHLLDQNRQPLSKESLANYQRILGIDALEMELNSDEAVSA